MIRGKSVTMVHKVASPSALAALVPKVQSVRQEITERTAGVALPSKEMVLSFVNKVSFVH